MCFNCSLTATAEAIEELYGASFPKEKFPAPVYFRSGFEHPPWPILKQGHTDRFELSSWGLIPFWTKSADGAAKIRNHTLNARVETLAEKPSFRGGVDKKRCGVLLDGFVEFRLYNGKKYPYRIGLPDGRPFLVAGLWDVWRDPESDTEIQTHTLVTTGAMGIAAQVHNTTLRMPFILGRETGKLWLDRNAAFKDITSGIGPFYESLKAWTISSDVSRPKAERNRPEIIEPCNYPELPQLTSVQ